MALTGDKLRSLVKRNLGFGADATDDAITDKALCRVRFQVTAPTAWATAGTDGTLIICKTDRRFIVDLVSINPSAVMTVSESVYDTLTFSVEDGAAGGLTTIATAVTNAAGVGTIAARVATAATLTSTTANLLIPAGYQISCAKTHASTGTAVPEGTLITVEGYWA